MQRSASTFGPLLRRWLGTALAGLRHERRLHFGHTHAVDGTLATARLMQRGAFTFGPLLRRRLGTALPCPRRSATIAPRSTASRS